MNGNEVSIKVAVEQFIAAKAVRKRERSLRITVLRNGLLSNLTQMVTIRELQNNPDNLALKRAMQDTMAGSKISKLSVYKVFKKFFQYLNHTPGYDLNLSIDDYVRRPEEDKRERQITLLKELHGEPKTIAMLTEEFAISDRTLRNDLNELENGIEFLGQAIKPTIQRGGRNGQVSYSSTVHPIFLPLNMTEVYALTVGLKKVAKGTPYEGILGDMADWIYSQLSDYGQNLIQKSLLAQKNQNMISFSHDRSSGFMDEKEMFIQKRQHRLAYLEKRRFTYKKGLTILLDRDGEVETIEGAFISYRVGDMIDIEYLNQPDRHETVHMDQIIKIICPESEHGRNTDYYRKRRFRHQNP